MPEPVYSVTIAVRHEISPSEAKALIEAIRKHPSVLRIRVTVPDPELSTAFDGVIEDQQAGLNLQEGR